MAEHDDAPAGGGLAPPVVAWGPPTASDAPPGYVQFGGTPAKVEPTATLRTASIVARLVGAGGSAIAGLVVLHRASVVERVAAGRANPSDLDLPKTLAGLTTQLGGFGALAGTVLLCLWSSRTVTNGNLVHPSARASAGMAGAGWFIPIGNFWLPWRHLRRAMGQCPRSSALAWWQGLTIGSTVALIPAAVPGAVAGVRDALHHEVSASLYRWQGYGLLASALVAALTTVVSIRAMHDVDDATSGRPLWPGT